MDPGRPGSRAGRQHRPAGVRADRRPAGPGQPVRPQGRPALRHRPGGFRGRGHVGGCRGEESRGRPSGQECAIGPPPGAHHRLDLGGGEAAIRRHRQDRRGVAGERAGAAAPGQGQSRAHAGEIHGQRPRDQPADARRRLRPHRHLEHQRRRYGFVLDRRLFRGNEDGQCPCRRRRRHQADGLRAAPDRDGGEHHAGHLDGQRRRQHPGAAGREPGLYLGAARPARAGARPDRPQARRRAAGGRHDRHRGGGHRPGAVADVVHGLRDRVAGPTASPAGGQVEADRR